MENFKVIRLLSLSTGILLLLCCTRADNPLANVNLAPFMQWRSAYECMQNISNHCNKKDVLNITGLLNISNAEIGEYCEAGCAEGTRAVLECIHYVKRDFWFGNGFTVKDLNDTINHGCDTNSTVNTNFKKSSATKAFQNGLVSLIASLATATLVSIFNI